MARWELLLSAEGYVLEELAAILPEGGGRICVQRRGDGYWLTGAAFEAASGYSEAVAVARESLDEVVGAYRLGVNEDCPVALGGRTVCYSDDGTVQHTAVSPFTFRIRTIGKAEPGDIVPRWMALAGSDDRVRRVLRLAGGEPFKWVSFVRIYEIIRDDIGDPVKRGYISRNQLARLKHTADNPDASGLDARHGSSRGQQPPDPPVTLPEARGLITVMVSRWIQDKLQGVP